VPIPVQSNIALEDINETTNDNNITTKQEGKFYHQRNRYKYSIKTDANAFAHVYVFLLINLF